MKKISFAVLFLFFILLLLEKLYTFIGTVDPLEKGQPSQKSTRVSQSFRQLEPSKKRDSQNTGREPSSSSSTPPSSANSNSVITSSTSATTSSISGSNFPTSASLSPITTLSKSSKGQALILSTRRRGPQKNPASSFRDSWREEFPLSPQTINNRAYLPFKNFRAVMKSQYDSNMGEIISGNDNFYLIRPFQQTNSSPEPGLMPNSNSIKIIYDPIFRPALMNSSSETIGMVTGTLIVKFNSVDEEGLRKLIQSLGLKILQIDTTIKSAYLVPVHAGIDLVQLQQKLLGYPEIISVHLEIFERAKRGA